MGTIADAYVQILPTTKGMSGNLTKALGGDAASAGASAGSVFGGNLVGTLTKVVAAAGIGKILSDAIGKGGELQQSIGGIETLFGAGGITNLQTYASSVGKSTAEVKEEFKGLIESQEKMLAYADQAYATAGLSANDYMQTVTGFAASLKQSTGDDMNALAEAANQAVIDMADNANKMGTPMESIQNAYAGFAKGQYQLLDNLKLGYGGTKGEMERLLKDAQKITGVKYDMDNLADVYSAIHVIQNELGITGTTSKEAAGTIQGSAASMKAAFDNLLGKITLGQDISNEIKFLVQSVGTFVFGNLVPALKNIATALPGALMSLFQEALPAIQMGLGTLLDSVPDLIMQKLENLQNVGTMILNLINQFAPQLGAEGSSMITEFMATMQQNLPHLLEVGSNIIVNLVQGLLAALPTLITSAGQMIMAFVQGFIPMIPTLLQAGVDLVMRLCEGLLAAAPDIAIAAFDLIVDFVAMIAENYPTIIQSGFELLGQLIAGIIEALPEIASACTKIYDHIKEKLGSIDWKKIGRDILTGIKNGIVNGIGIMGEAASAIKEQLMSKLTSAFKIGSPSKLMRDEIGKWIPYGIAEGITDNAAVVSKSVQGIVDDATAFDSNIALGVANNSKPLSGEVTTTNAAMETLNNRLNNLATAMSIYSDSLASGNNVTVTLEGDAQSIFKTVRRQNNIYKTSTGRSAFA